MPTIRVRAARDDEHAVWMPLWRGYQAFYKVDMIEHVYAQAKARGCARVHWLTHESNVEAMKLYDRIADKPGFVQYRKAV